MLDCSKSSALAMELLQSCTKPSISSVVQYITDMFIMQQLQRWSDSKLTKHSPQLTLNTFGPRQNGRHFADDIFKCIFVNENVWIPIKISLKFVPKGPINNIPALVQIMAWRRAGDKPLSEPMRVSLPTQLCFTRPQWVMCFFVSNFEKKMLWHSWFTLWKLGN